MIASNESYFKICLIGDTQVGKTSLLSTASGKDFKELSEPTIEVAFDFFNLNVDDTSVKVQVWDLAGRDEFKEIVKKYLNLAGAILLVYDVTNRQSFINVDSWLSAIQEGVEKEVQMVLVGNKCDQDKREVTYEEGLQKAESYGLRYIETSAKNSLNALEAFNLVISKVKAEDLEKKVQKIVDDGFQLSTKIAKTTDCDTCFWTKAQFEDPQECA